MNYEKKYKDALAKGREILNNDCSSESTKECCREIFPELTESEDERIRKAISYSISQSAHHDGILIDGITKEQAYAWLEKQNKQDILDEEDEKMLEKCISVIEEPRDSRSGWPIYIDEIEWLKSLSSRRHWKPSDEQMMALKHAIGAYKAEGFHSTEARLYELYNDLKKLT